ncbi:MAG: circadian clock protein KaiB [Deltaproteobacteria bacterium]|nr:circadian clock protein KaiB [Deltaproteobacteria bacterium]
MYTFKLYVVGSTPRSARAIDNLREFLESDLKGAYSLEVIDLLKDPTAGDGDKILATPSAIRVSPSPERRILGDFSDKAKVFAGLGLEPD